MFVFRESDHTYWLDGKRVPSATECIRLAGLERPFGGDPAVLAAAAARGTDVHAYIAERLAGQDATVALERSRGYAAAADSYLRKRPLTPILIETPLYGEIEGYGYGVIADTLAWSGLELLLIDWKTSARVPRWAGVQLAAQALALGQNGLQPGHAMSRLVVQLAQDGTWRERLYEDAADRDQWTKTLFEAHRRIEDGRLYAEPVMLS